MPRRDWSPSDKKRYEQIVAACKIQHGRKKGNASSCKRVAAATVERDRGLSGLSGCAPCTPRPTGGGSGVTSPFAGRMRGLRGSGPVMSGEFRPLRGTVDEHNARAGQYIGDAWTDFANDDLIDASRMVSKAEAEASWVPKADPRRSGPTGLMSRIARLLSSIEQKRAGGYVEGAAGARREVYEREANIRRRRQDADDRREE